MNCSLPRSSWSWTYIGMSSKPMTQVDKKTNTALRRRMIGFSIRCGKQCINEAKTHDPAVNWMKNFTSCMNVLLEKL